MQSIEFLKKKFSEKFPLSEGGHSQLTTALGKIDLNYLINNENFITASETKENFDSRKTKIKDENYKTLYDQLVSEWYEAEALEKYDDAILITPRAAKRKHRDTRIKQIDEPENLMDEENEELIGIDVMESIDDVHPIHSFAKIHPQTYKFIDLKDLIINKSSSDISFTDYDDELDDSMSYEGSIQSSSIN